MKITIIFPGQEVETAKVTAPVMPLAPILLAALTPDEHEVSLVDVPFGDEVDYEADTEMVAITVRTPGGGRLRNSRQFSGQGEEGHLGGTAHLCFPARG